jgi:lipopolysaccharide exporter
MTSTSTVPQAQGATRPKKPKSFAANVRGNALWSMATTIVLRLSGMIVTALVAHIMNPRAFGIFAVAMTVFTIVSALGEFGVVSCLIRADLDIDTLAPTLCAISWASSLLMAGVIYVYADPIASLLGSSAAAAPVRVMAYVVLIWGVAAVPTAQCIRDYKQDKLFLANVLAFIPSTALLLLLGKHGQGAMAFAWSRVVGQLISSFVVIIATPRFYFPRMSRSALGILFRFGIPVAAANCISNFLSNVDYAFIGHLAGPAMLGTYVLAFNVSGWSSSLLGGMLTSVSTTSFSRVKDDSARLMRAMEDAVRAVMLVAAPACMIVMALARPIVLALYGERWAAAAPVLEILSIYGLISIVGTLFSSVLTALGKPRSVLGIQLIWLIGLFPAMAVGVYKDGIIGAAIAHIAIICPIVLPCYIVAIKRASDIRLGLLVRAAAGPFLASAIAATIAWLTASQFGPSPLKLIAGMAAGVLCYTTLTAPQLIVVLGRGRISHPVLKRIFSTYYKIGRSIGIPLGPPPRHARRRAAHAAVRVHVESF